MDQALINNLIVRFSDLGLKLLGAIAVWIIGRWLIKFAVNLLAKRMTARKVDPTIVGYSRSTLTVVLDIALVVVMMGVLGIETTSFAAFIAGAGLAIGAAWSGLLSNFAAGAFLVILRPFKTGDLINGGGAEGVVQEIGLFVTSILTQDNVLTIVGNSKVLGSNLKNYSTHARRVEMTGSISRSSDLARVLTEVKERLGKIQHVLVNPDPEVNLLSFTEGSCKIGIRPYVLAPHYWEVCSAAAESLRDVLTSIALPGHEAEEGEGEAFEAGEAAEGGEGGEEAEEGGEKEAE